jgi:hypothetical protein
MLAIEVGDVVARAISAKINAPWQTTAQCAAEFHDPANPIWAQIYSLQVP